jgi:lipoprotein-anchoring transpeptidase ErfK/SrfK
LGAARATAADRWAPDALYQAEAAMRAALLEHRRQESRFYLARDFRAARSSLELAEEKAVSAREQSTVAREQARAAADEALGAAEEAVSEADHYAAVVHLARREQLLLERARLSYREARIHHRNGDHLAAAELAESAVDQAFKVLHEAAGLASRFTDSERVRTWRRWIEETVAWSRRTGAAVVVVNKESHQLTLYAGGRPLRTYPADLGSNTAGTKLRSGDNATPEGRYRITTKKGQGQSKYYKALLLNYPNDDDRARFARLKRAGQIPARATPGGLIEIHGDGGRRKDWTQGCVAVRNDHMDELFRRVEVGTPVTIVGSTGDGGVFTDLVRRYRTQGGGAGRP